MREIEIAQCLCIGPDKAPTEGICQPWNAEVKTTYMTFEPDDHTCPRELAVGVGLDDDIFKMLDGGFSFHGDLRFL
jgi:hypothetical protein